MLSDVACIRLKREINSMLNRGSYMSAHVLRVRETVIKGEACLAFYHFFATSITNSIIQ